MLAFSTPELYSFAHDQRGEQLAFAMPCEANRVKALESRNNGIIELKQLLKIDFGK